MLNIHWKDWCWSSNTLTTWLELLTHWKRPWCWTRLRVRGEGANRKWNGWMESLTQWTWVWANSRRWWRTGKPGMLQSIAKSRTQQNNNKGSIPLNNNNSKVYDIKVPSPRCVCRLVPSGWNPRGMCPLLKCRVSLDGLHLALILF